MIPNVDAPEDFGHFQPINLCSVAYKIMVKIMVFRLAPIIGKTVLAEQSLFIWDRSIFDNMSIAQELVNSMNRKIRGGNVMLKIDMAKAYDHVDLSFLLEGLQ